MSSFVVNTQKSAEQFVLSMTKKGITDIPVIEMSFLVDVSGSFDDEHRSGISSAFLARFVPWAMKLDPDKKIDVFTFSNGERNVQHVNFVTEQNFDNYIKREVVDKVKGYNGGTDYSYAIEASLREFGFLGSIESVQETVTETKKAGMFGRLMGKKDEVVQTTKTVEKEVFKQKRRALCIVLTDGENSDHERTVQVLQESQQRGDDVYYIFVGMNSSSNVHFKNITKLGDLFNNTGFVRVTDLKAFANQSDEDMNEKFLTDEFVQWMKS